MKFAPLLSDDYLASAWARELGAYNAGGHDAAILARLRHRDERDLARTETEASDSFVQQFFREVSGHWITCESSEFLEIPADLG